MSTVWKHRKVYLHDLAPYYQNKEQCFNSQQVVYEVSVLEGKADLLYGVTTVHPGQVDEEYFMTKGHRHQNQALGEVYLGHLGHGVLRLWQQDGSVVDEAVFPGSVHLIDGTQGHRLINTGQQDLVVQAVWSKQAGYCYFEEECA